MAKALFWIGIIGMWLGGAIGVIAEEEIINIFGGVIFGVSVIIWRISKDFIEEKDSS
jgi:hypothetical protein